MAQDLRRALESADAMRKEAPLGAYRAYGYLEAAAERTLGLLEGYCGSFCLERGNPVKKAVAHG